MMYLDYDGFQLTSSADRNGDRLSFEVEIGLVEVSMHRLHSISEDL